MVLTAAGLGARDKYLVHSLLTNLPPIASRWTGAPEGWTMERTYESGGGRIL